MHVPSRKLGSTVSFLQKPLFFAPRSCNDFSFAKFEVNTSFPIRVGQHFFVDPLTQVIENAKYTG